MFFGTAKPMSKGTLHAVHPTWHYHGQSVAACDRWLVIGSLRPFQEHEYPRICSRPACNEALLAAREAVEGER